MVFIVIRYSYLMVWFFCLVRDIELVRCQKWFEHVAQKAHGFCCCKYVICIIFSRKDISITVRLYIRTQVVSIFGEQIARICARSVVHTYLMSSCFYIEQTYLMSTCVYILYTYLYLGCTCI